MWDTIPPWDKLHMISLDPHMNSRMLSSVHPSNLHPSMFANRTDFEMAMRSMQSHRRGKHPVESFQNAVMVLAQEYLVPEGVEVDVEVSHREIIVRVPSMVAGDADENFDVFRDRVLALIAERNSPAKRPDDASGIDRYMQRMLMGEWFPNQQVAITLEDQPNY